MPWHLRAWPAAFRRRMTPLSRRLRRPATALVIAALAFAHGCTALPNPPIAGADPASPAARTPPVGYRSTVGPYVSRRPAEPAPWREQNQRVAPQPPASE
jgi:hypothetical protein